MSITKILPDVVDPNSDLTDESDEIKSLAATYCSEEQKAKHESAMESGGLR